MNFLSKVNSLLERIGELEAPDFDGVVSRKAVAAWQDSLLFISSTMRWRHLRVQVAANSWVGDSVANVPKYQTVLHVYHEGCTLREAPFEDVLKAIQASTLSGVPTVWAQRNEGSILLTPTSNLEKPKVLFDLILLPTVPQLVSDVIQLPTQFEQCVDLYAEALLHQRHTTDTVAFSQVKQQLEQQLQLLRIREGGDNSRQMRW